MRRPSLLFALGAWFLLFGCAPPPPTPPSDMFPEGSARVCADEFHAMTATPSPDGEGWCCVPGYPTCSCGYFGGFVAERCACGDVLNPAISGYCDLHPLDWALGTDAHGCARYDARSIPGAHCCNCPDLGFDAGLDDAGVEDATVDDASVDDGG